MKITADSNVLIRILTNDDSEQASVASNALSNADLIAISMQTLCEVVWVLQGSYKVSRDDISSAIHALIEIQGVVVNRPAVETGLKVLNRGGDFADGVIAFDGALQGGATFVSFDKRAIKALESEGHPCKLLPS